MNPAFPAGFFYILTMKYLIVGLGNIGPEYEITRHNAGFLVLDRLADLKDAKFEPGRLANIARCKHKGRSLYLIKPTTYMNLSGRSVNFWMQELKIPLQRVLVVSDDISIPLGKLRLRAKGSSAGHNGLNNIEEVLQSREYSRLKFGIGADFRQGGQIDYVLSSFSQKELDDLVAILDKACEMILDFTILGVTRAMNLHN